MAICNTEVICNTEAVSAHDQIERQVRSASATLEYATRKLGAADLEVKEAKARLDDALREHERARVAVQKYRDKIAALPNVGPPLEPVDQDSDTLHVEAWLLENLERTSDDSIVPVTLIMHAYWDDCRRKGIAAPLVGNIALGRCISRLWPEAGGCNASYRNTVMRHRTGLRFTDEALEALGKLERLAPSFLADLRKRKRV